MALHWLSFSGPVDFLGVVLVEADDEASALSAVNDACVNPGGQVLAIDVPYIAGDEECEAIYALPRLTLLTRADLEVRIAVVKICEPTEAEQQMLDEHATVVCAEHNLRREKALLRKRVLELYVHERMTMRQVVEKLAEEGIATTVKTVWADLGE